MTNNATFISQICPPVRMVNRGYTVVEGATRRRPLPPTKECLEDLYVHRGLTVGAIADVLGRSVWNVYDHLKLNGISAKRTPPPADELYAAAWEKGRQGAAREYGVKPSTITRWLKRYHARGEVRSYSTRRYADQISTKLHRPKVGREELEAYLATHSKKATAEHFGVTPVSVWKWIRYYKEHPQA